MIKHYIQAFFSSTAFMGLYTLHKNALKFLLTRALLTPGSPGFVLILLIITVPTDLLFIAVTWIFLVLFSLFAIFALGRALIALIISLFK